MSRRIDNKELIAKLQQLEGLTNEEKSTLMALINEEKSYGLVWEDSPEEVEENLRFHIPVLREVTGRALTDGGADAPNHILIEGDNLDALTALSYTHENSIDVIYIDPPYNTGNEDFVYNDKYVNPEDSYRHSKWLSFMNRRLRIAKRLLSDKGVIFISIDDNEQANLKLLCDEVFGGNNFVAKFDWRKKTGANDAKDIAVITESVLLYTKNHSFTIEQKIWNQDDNSINKDRYKYSDEFVETRGKFYYDTLDRGGLQYSDSLNYGIEAPDGGIIFPNGRDHYENDGWIWKWGKDKIKWGLEQKFLEFIKSKKSKGSQYTIKYKVYQYVDNEGNLRERSGRAYSNLITEPINQQGNSEMTSIFGGKNPFSNPKPVGLLTYLLKTVSQTPTVLDFFAGSGTTLHATMLLNAEDGGHRQCILVTNNENGICENVTYERNKRVIQGYTTPKGQQVEGLHNNNLRYYKIDYTNRSHTHENRMVLAQSMTELLQIKNGAYETPSCFGHLKVKPRYMRYFRGDNDVIVVYFPEIIPHLVNEIKEMSFNEKLQVYVAIDGNYPFADEFTPVASKVNVVAIPSVYYHALKHVLPDASGEPIPDDTPNDEDAELLSEANKNDYQD